MLQHYVPFHELSRILILYPKGYALLMHYRLKYRQWCHNGMKDTANYNFGPFCSFRFRRMRVLRVG